MTAIDGIERLETTGLWRPEAGAQRQEVYVSIGEAELVVQDRSGSALSHWSLPALIRLNPGRDPARYAPARRADEELEITEPEMVAALDRVVDAVARGRQRPGRLRRILTGLTVGGGLGLLLMWLPDALRDQAAGILPQSQQQDIGNRMLSELTLLTGPPCRTVTGDEALETLRSRVLPTTPARLAVLRDLPQPALALPGGVLVLSDTPLVTQDDPDVVAGHLLAAAVTAADAPPLVSFLRSLTTVDLIRLMVAGDVTDEEITSYVEGILLDAPALLPAENLRTAFAASGIAWTPYAEATGQPVGTVTPSDMVPALNDTLWLTLREICNG
ncbi:hypothetical protein [Jannaschia sp. 2305UL9-9]|uniref:hypothetical protein n=1 Tax=Jannaschia sp. 2305UL9-9 TaxID=3121638 RepID=UPI003527A5E4